MLVMGFIKNIDCSLPFHFDFNLISLTLPYKLIIFFDIRSINENADFNFRTEILCGIYRSDHTCELCYSLDFPTLLIQPRFRDNQISSYVLLCLKQICGQF